MRLTHQQLQRLIGRLILEEKTESAASGKTREAFLKDEIKAALKPGAVIKVFNARELTDEPFIESSVIGNGNRVSTQILSGVDPFKFKEGKGASGDALGVDSSGGALEDIIIRICPPVLIPFVCASEARDTRATEVPSVPSLSSGDLEAAKKNKRGKKEEPAVDPEANAFEMMGGDVKQALSKIARNEAVQAATREISASAISSTPGDYSGFNITDWPYLSFEFDFESDETLSQAVFKPRYGTVLKVDFERDPNLEDDAFSPYEKVFKRTGLYDGSYDSLDEAAKSRAKEAIERAMKEVASKKMITATFDILEPVSAVALHLVNLCSLPFYKVTIDGKTYRLRPK